jgi:hypothetical protein
VNKFIVALTVFCFFSSALAGPKGTVPRSAATRYPLHAQRDGFSIGAKLLSRKEARRTFVSDVNSCCITVEIAVYPDKTKSLNISLNDFILRAKNAESAMKASSPRIVAASVQKNAKSGRDIAVYPTTTIGYNSGSVYDPVTGTRQGGGVYTQSGVGVAIGSPNGPGVSDKDRSVMETELTEKGLPEGAASSPVAGYVYFPVLPKKKADYQVEYVSDGKKLVLPVHVE